MKYFSLVIFLLIVSQVKSQVGFTNTYGAFGLYNESSDIDVDTNGNVYLCGSSGGLGAQNGDILVIKTDSSGNQLWSQVYGNENSEYGIALSLFGDAGFVSIGNTNSGDNNDYDVYVLRAGANGDVLWDTTLRTNFWDQAADAITLRDGGFALLINEWGTTGEEKSFACYKFNADNNLVWVYRPETVNFREGNTIIELADSSLLIGGSGIAVNDNQDLQLTKLTYEGDEDWVRFYGDELTEWIADLTLTNDNRIGVAANRILEGGQISPQLISLDTNGDILHQFFDPNFAEVTSVSYNPVTNSYFFSWNFINSSGTPKASIFNFTNDFVFRCNVVVTPDPFQEQYGSKTAIGVNGQMHLTGKIIGTGPGITSLFSFKCGDFCQNDQSLQVGIEETIENTSILLFPNPADDFLYLKKSSPESVNQINLIDIAGRIRDLEFHLAGDIVAIDLKNEADGFYYISLVYTKNGLEIKSIPQPIIISRKK